MVKITQVTTGRAPAFLLAGLLVTAGAMAAKPDWVAGGKPGKSGQHQQTQVQERQDSPSQGRPDRAAGHFGDDQRAVIRNYYSEQYRVGRCPPGLAKKNNGCMPPGQARKWALGQPLPRDVVVYSLPPAIVVQLGVAPAGHRYVRVASDILLIAIGTGLVVDAIQDLGR
ncbi:conserved hypothetical protein [Rhodoferax ferrireducens T118]|uniref:Nickel/cobalt transporter regulator n=1 Tax=Albidiferax ferrireducens (strain ATCC BAA-621 / DSM 15236 / T118) TaxID=338969 RepID=Q223L1_ALBFT|nr:hypothetical protein [Rhodoferax ferrireducens]ABD67819.1 conserved hypothetical protein [Rhodoferax ferrireducens T118]